MKKTVQFVSKEAIEAGLKASPMEILQFIEDYRQLHATGEAARSKSILISMKVPEELLRAFRFKAKQEGVLYQTQIKKLMKRWVTE